MVKSFSIGIMALQNHINFKRYLIPKTYSETKKTKTPSISCRLGIQFLILQNDR